MDIVAATFLPDKRNNFNSLVPFSSFLWSESKVAFSAHLLELLGSLQAFCKRNYVLAIEENSFCREIVDHIFIALAHVFMNIAIDLG